MAERTLQELLENELGRRHESPDDLKTIHITADNSGFRPSGCREIDFAGLEQYRGDTGFGSESLPRIYAWTEDRVYFKQVYDGAEDVTSVPRNPTDEEPASFGGG